MQGCFSYTKNKRIPQALFSINYRLLYRMYNNILLLSNIINHTDKPLPEEFKLFSYGDNRAFKTTTGYFNISLTKEQAKKLMSQYADNDLSIDYDHDMISASVPGYERIKAGSVKLALKDDGLYAVNVRWTERAAKLLTSGEMDSISPAIMQSTKDGSVLKIINVALTNTPALENMKALMLSKYNKEKTMSEQESQFEASVLTLTGTSDKSEALGILVAYKQSMDQVKLLSASVAEKDSEINQLKINMMLDKAQNEGRLTPAKRDEIVPLIPELGLGGLRVVLSTLQPKQEMPVEPKTEVKVLTGVVSKEAEKIAKYMKLNTEQFENARIESLSVASNAASKRGK